MSKGSHHDHVKYTKLKQKQKKIERLKTLYGHLNSENGQLK